MSDANGTGATEVETGRPTIEGYRQGSAADEIFYAIEGRLAELEEQQSGGDWLKINQGSEHEFTRQGLRDITEISRIMYLKNPLIKRGINVKRSYVWGQGVSVKAANVDIHEAIKAFEDDEKNVVTLTSHQARMNAEQELETDGNLFFAFFANETTGRVRVRTMPFGEIDEVIFNPEDKKEPWYYLRRWTEEKVLASGVRESVRQAAWYPDWRYNPVKKPVILDGDTVKWGVSVFHIKVGGYSDWTFGVSEIYDALDWARAYKDFLQDWASIVKAHRRFAWRLDTPGGRRGIAAAKTKLNTTLSTGGSGEAETNPPPLVGSTFIGSEGANLTPVRTSGATVSAEDGRRLLLMVAASTGLPETFFGDVSVGSLATAKSLDRPTELAMKDRQTLWADVLGSIYRFVTLWAVKASSGPLQGLGRIERTVEDGVIEERVIWNEDVDSSVAVSFPPLVEGDAKDRVEALTMAATLGQSGTLAGTLDQVTLARLLLVTLGVPDVDEIIEKQFPDGEVPEESAPTPGRSAAEAAQMATMGTLKEMLEKGGSNGQRDSNGSDSTYRGDGRSPEVARG